MLSEAVTSVLAERFTMPELCALHDEAIVRRHDAASRKERRVLQHLADTYAWAIAERIVKEGRNER